MQDNFLWDAILNSEYVDWQKAWHELSRLHSTGIVSQVRLGRPPDYLAIRGCSKKPDLSRGLASLVWERLESLNSFQLMNTGGKRSSALSWRSFVILTWQLFSSANEPLGISWLPTVNSFGGLSTESSIRSIYFLGILSKPIEYYIHLQGLEKTEWEEVRDYRAIIMI